MFPMPSLRKFLRHMCVFGNTCCKPTGKAAEYKHKIHSVLSFNILNRPPNSDSTPLKKISETCLTSPLLMRIIHRHECLWFLWNTIPSTRGLPKCTVATGLPIDVLKICKSASKRWNNNYIESTKIIWAVFKIHLSFHYTGWFIGIPLLDSYNPQYIGY